MNISKFCSIGLVVALTTGFSFKFLWKASANAQPCVGASCNNRNPVEYRCNIDATVVEQIDKTIYRWQDAWQPRQIIIQKVYSGSCRASWTRAYIPNDTFLFVKEHNPATGGELVYGLIKASGTGYFWADGYMSNGDVPNQACVSLPIFSNENGYDLYDRHCTDSNENNITLP